MLWMSTSAIQTNIRNINHYINVYTYYIMVTRLNGSTIKPKKIIYEN